MLLLSIESSAKSCSVALTRQGRLLGQYYQNCGLTHSKTLLPLLSGLMENVGVTLKEVDAIAVAAGPGSCTGIRIGISTVKGLALGADKPCLGVSTLEAMAQPALPCADGVVCCAMDARAGQVYNAVFSAPDGRRVCEDRAISLADLQKELAAQKKSVFFVGDGAELCYNYWQEHAHCASLAPEHLRFQSAYGVALTAERLLSEGHKPVCAQDLAPFYLRKPQAERLRLEKIQAKGAI